MVSRNFRTVVQRNESASARANNRATTEWRRPGTPPFPAKEDIFPFAAACNPGNSASSGKLRHPVSPSGTNFYATANVRPKPAAIATLSYEKALLCRTESGENGSDVTQESLDTRQILAALTAFKRGDFSVRLPDDWTGVAGKVADTFNDVIALNQRMTRELDRIGRVVGKEGRISQRASIGDVSNAWADSIGSVNALIGDLVNPTSEMARVIGAVAKGDLSKTMATEIEGRPLEGEFLRTAKTVNTMVDQLGAFASEVTRVAREVGTEGKLGGQAKVKGVAGTWKDLTENVNLMAGNLTAQVRNIAKVTTAVANGDLTKKITVDVKGEFLELKDTINVMVDQLRSFASEVTRVAREVGSEGKLGGQARVEGVSGTWKDLTDSVNFMARNLTGQVRNIAEVTTAVANWRSLQEDHGRCEGRDSGTEEHDQHDGGSAQLVRVGSDSRGARSGHGRKTWRSGGSEGRGRHLERSDRLGELRWPVI